MKQNSLSKNKLTALFLALLLCTPVFASCGSDTSPAETVGEAVGEAAAEPATAPETEEETSYTYIDGICRGKDTGNMKIFYFCGI